MLVLVTTNEPLRTLHPAVARPGRCAANIEFERLSAEEGSAWFERHGSDTRPDGPVLLAELFAQLEGRGLSAMPPAGFAD